MNETSLSLHEMRVLTLMARKNYTLLVWHQQTNQDIELNDRSMPRLTWDRLCDWLTLDWITLCGHEDIPYSNDMRYGVYEITEQGMEALRMQS